MLTSEIQVSFRSFFPWLFQQALLCHPEITTQRRIFECLFQLENIEQIDVSFSRVSPVIDHEFRHNIVKVVCGPTR